MTELAEEFTEHERRTLSDAQKAERAYRLAEQIIAQCDGRILVLNGFSTRNYAVLSFLRIFPPELTELTDLLGLDCNDTRISDLAPLAGLKNLQHLRCSGTQISDLAPIAGLENFQGLDCDGTPISNLAPLAGLKNLQHLNCGGTLISDLAPLAGLRNLLHLNCDRTHIYDLAPLAGLRNLLHLNCDRTLVSNLAPLAGLKNLQKLSMRGLHIPNPVPPDLWQLPHLSAVDAEKSMIAVFPVKLFAEDINHLPKIRAYLAENPPASDEIPELAAELMREAAQSDTAYIVVDGQLSPRDAPIDTPPVRINPTALNQLLQEQLAGCDALAGTIKHYPNQGYTLKFCAYLENYRQELLRKQTLACDVQSQQAEDYAWRSMARFYDPLQIFVRDEIFNNAFDPAFQRQVQDLDQTHEDLRQYMQPDRRALPARVSPDKREVSDDQAESMEQIPQNPVLMAVLDTEGKKDFQGLAKEVKEIREDPDLSSAYQQTRLRALRDSFRGKLAAMAVALKKYAPKLIVRIGEQVIVGAIMQYLGIQPPK